MLTSVSETPLRQLAKTATANAIAGAAAGMALGVVHGMISMHQSQLRDRYAMAAEGLTHVGTGAILGALAATATALAGVSVAAIAGRGVLAVALPMIASTVVTGSAHKHVDRAVRAWSEDAVKSVRRALEPQASREIT